MKEIIVNNLSFSYGQYTILKDINIDIDKHEKIGLIGENGVGKSTLLKLFVGLLDQYEGDIQIEGLKVEKKNYKDIREKVGYVFQDSDSQLFLNTVYDDVAFGPMNYGYSKEEVDKRVNDALEKLGILHLKDRQVYRMSGGQKKLVSLATILSMNPDIILLDEPSIALDPKNRRQLIHILESMNDTMIIASHDLDFILDTCDRVILLYDGHIEKDGEVKDVLKDKELLERCGLELPFIYQGGNL